MRWVYPLVVLLLCLHAVKVKLPVECQGVFVVHLDMAVRFTKNGVNNEGEMKGLMIKE